MSGVLAISRDSIGCLLRRRGLRTFMLVCTVLTLLLGLAAGVARNYIENAQEAVREHESQQDTAQPSGQGSEVDEAEQDGVNRTFLRASVNVIVWYFGVTTLLGVFATLYVGATGVRRNMETGATTETISGSVSRGQYLLGKYLGAMTVVLGFWVLLGTEIVLFGHLLQADGAPTSWHFELVYLLCLGLLVGSMAFMLSLYMPPFLAGCITLFANGDLFRENLNESNPFYYLHFVLPDQGLFDVSELRGIAAFTQGTDMLLRVLYALDFAAILFLLALLRFCLIDLKRYERHD